MSNWYKKSQVTEDPLNGDLNDSFFDAPAQEVRYRATFPIDVFIEDTGDENRNKEEVYEIIKEGLEMGNLPNHRLYPNDIVRYRSF